MVRIKVAVFPWYLFSSNFCGWSVFGDDISGGELFKALSSTLDQFPPVGIFDWEHGADL